MVWTSLSVHPRSQKATLSMATPRADSYSATSGAAVHAGRFSQPTWLQGMPLNTWTEISGTSGAGGSAIDAYSGFCLKPSNSEIIIAAAGGHSDSSDNGVYSLRLSDNDPSWATRRASSTPTADVFYYADGRPTSRHIYQYIHYIESIDSVLLAGCNFGFGPNTPTHGGMDLFDLQTNDWKARYTYADNPGAGYGVVQDGNACIWTNGGRKFDTATNTWTTPGASILRFPTTYDSARNLIFSMCYGDGQGFNLELGLQAYKVDASTGASTVVTFNSSAALTALIAAQPTYAAMDYDPLLDKFLFYHGGEPGKVYTITPNAGTAWDMGVLTTSGTPALTPAGGSGINKRFVYVPAYKGVVLLPQASSNLYFLRTA